MRRSVSKLMAWYARAFDHPFKIRIIHTIFRTFLQDGALLPLNGALLSVDPADFIGWAILKTGRYEPNTISLMVDILRNTPGWFIDVGANIGLHSVIACSIPAVRCAAIEPDPENFRRLQRNIAINGFANISICNFALACEARPIRLELPVEGNRGTVRVASEEVARPASIQSPYSAALTFDSVAKQLGIESVELMKIDVEGFELDVLEGLDFKKPHRPKNIILEFSDYGERFCGTNRGGRAVVHSFLASKGYKAFDVFGTPISEVDAPCESNAWFRDMNNCSPLLTAVAGEKRSPERETDCNCALTADPELPLPPLHSSGIERLVGWRFARRLQAASGRP